MPDLKRTARRFTAVLGLLNMPAEGTPDFDRPQALMDVKGFAGWVRPANWDGSSLMKGTANTDFEHWDWVQTTIDLRLAGTNRPKLGAFPNGKPGYVFGDGTPELPGTGDGNGALRADAGVAMLGKEGSVFWAQVLGADPGGGTVWGTIPGENGISVTHNFSTGVMEVRNPVTSGYVIRHNVDQRGAGPHQFELHWYQVTASGTTTTTMVLCKDGAAVGGGPATGLPAMTSSRMMLGGLSTTGAVGAPAARLTLSGLPYTHEALILPGREADLALFRNYMKTEYGTP